MLNEWLHWSTREPSPYNGFQVTDVMEAQPPTDAAINHLKDLLTHARLDPSFLWDAAQYLGWNNVRVLMAEFQPHGMTARRGEFGEVLSSAMLSQFHDYSIPVQKLRFAISSDQSLPRTDVIALRLDRRREITEVGFVESKLRTVNDTNVAVEGYEQLKHDYEERLPDMLRFVAQRLHERRDPLFDVFMKYMRDRRDRSNQDSFQLCLVWERPVWSETVLKNLEDNQVELDRLNVHVTLIQGLAQLTNELFAMLGVEAVSDDN